MKLSIIFTKEELELIEESLIFSIMHSNNKRKMKKYKALEGK